MLTEERARFIYQTAPSLGIAEPEARQILKIAQTLHTWAVHECNGEIERDEATGLCYWYYVNANYLDPCDPRYRRRTADRETSALKRLPALLPEGVTFGHQGDPRGYVLHLVANGREYGVPSQG